MWGPEFYCRLCYTYKSKTKVQKRNFVKSLIFIPEGFFGIENPQKSLKIPKLIPVRFSKSLNLVRLFWSDIPLGFRYCE